MNRAEFEADVRREGYEVHEGEIKPNVNRKGHAHEFDARLFILEGSLTLVVGADRHTYGPVTPAASRRERRTKSILGRTACATWRGADGQREHRKVG